jgi:hypothetical protein
MTKRSSLISHSKRRASERYGLNLSRLDLLRIVDLILGKSATFVRRHTNRVSEWEVIYSGKRLRLLYDCRRKMVVTFLPDSRSDLRFRQNLLEAESEDLVNNEDFAGSGFWEREAEAAVAE